MPGAGKTLVGLNIATQHLGQDDTHAVFLSGNGPLVAVLREALVEDDLQRQRALGNTPERKGAVIVCLVGGGQQIHTGEAGIGAWLDALRDTYPRRSDSKPTASICAWM
ncbi:DNA/RNA helicase domain-containing protein [Gemmatimonas aurantiaca]|uniref:DNA/RNA helicase domain-containing protein n=1 Tax=Gemmatimonas aurantiaca TaxID=173480 RepID=UPI0031F40691